MLDQMSKEEKLEYIYHFKEAFEQRVFAQLGDGILPPIDDSKNTIEIMYNGEPHLFVIIEYSPMTISAVVIPKSKIREPEVHTHYIILDIAESNADIDALLRAYQELVANPWIEMEVDFL